MEEVLRIVVVGGGAGGLELVVRLARKFRRHKNVEVGLVDKNPTHIWKPLLHEVATGSLNSYHDEVSYRMLAHKHRFEFTLGSVASIDTSRRVLSLAAIDDQDGEPLVAPRSLSYSELVLSPGSLSNDFGTTGVSDHCLMLDSRSQAERFHQQFIQQLHRLTASESVDSHAESLADSLAVVIVGGGATGVELAADLHNVAEQLPDYGFERFSADKLQVTVIEAGPSLLAQLPERISSSVKSELEKIGVSVLTDTKVVSASKDGVVIQDGETVAATIIVWAAGIRAPEFLADSGFDVDRIGRVKVNPDLRVLGHDNIFAIGDCCACPMENGDMVPPRAQSAHQMAKHACKNIVRHYKGRDLKPFVYQDFGSLISLSEFSTIGNLMGNLLRGTVFVEGWLARLFYLSLYRMHQRTVQGTVSMLLVMLGDRIYRATRADLKLH